MTDPFGLGLGGAAPGGGEGGAPVVITPPVYETADQQLADGTDGSTVAASVAKPTNLASGDLVVLQLFCNDAVVSPIPTLPSGFTLIDEVSHGGGSHPQIIACWKVAGASEPATYDFGLFGIVSTWRLVASRITGHRLVGGSPVDKTSKFTEGATSDTTVIPSLTPAEINTLLLSSATRRNSNASMTPPATSTEVFDFGGDVDPANPAAAGARETLASADPTGTRTWTHGTGRHAGMMFNLFGAAS